MPFTQEEIDALASKGGLFDNYVEKTESVMAGSGGLFDRLAASYIAASQVGIDLASSVPIKDLMDGISATVYGLVVSEVEVNSYRRKTGKEGKMLTFTIGDATGQIKVVIWDEKCIDMLLEMDIGKDSKIKIANGIAKENNYGRQISPGRWGSVVYNPEDFPDLEAGTEKREKITPIEDIQIGGNYSVTGEIATVFDLRDFTRRSGSMGHVLNVILMDTTSSVKVVLWDELAVKYSNISQGQSVIFHDLSARQNRDIVELHSTYRSSIDLVETG